MNENPRYNHADYPQSPSYYTAPNEVEIDGRSVKLTVLHVMHAWGVVDYWLVSALAHLLRAGRKDGETVYQALANSFVCFALWMKSEREPVPYYSAELHRMRVEIDELNEGLDDARNCANASDREVARLRSELKATACGRKITPPSDSDMRMTKFEARWPSDNPLPGMLDALNMLHGAVEREAASKGLSIALRDVEESEQASPPSPRSGLYLAKLKATQGSDAPATATLPTAAEIDRFVADGERVHSLSILAGEGEDVTVVCDEKALSRAGIGVTRAPGVTTFTRKAAPTIDTPAVAADEWADDDLRAWLDARYKSRPIDVVIGRWRWELSDDGEGRGVYFDPTGPTGPMSEHGDGKWSMTSGPRRNMTATEAARALHRILTEPAP